MAETSALLLILLLSHVVLDFVWPAWCTQKPRVVSIGRVSGRSLVHGAVVFLTLYLARQQFLVAVWAGLFVALSWGLASGLIPRAEKKPVLAFVAEQFVHLLVLLAIWLTSEGYWGQVIGYIKDLASPRHLLILLAYLLILRPASMLIGSLLSPLLETINNAGSLKSAGTLIGYLERLLILTFVLLEQWEAIGFLLTAKSILRYNEVKGAHQRAWSEYVLLGSLLSFTLAIGVGLLVSVLKM